MRHAILALAVLSLAACGSSGGESRKIAEKIAMGVIEMKWDDVQAHISDSALLKALIGLRSELDMHSGGNARHIEFVECSESKSGANTIVKIHHRLRLDSHMAFQNADGVTGRVKYEMTMAKAGDKWTVSTMTWKFEKEPK
jgi:hypothetical protein